MKILNLAFFVFMAMIFSQISLAGDDVLVVLKKRSLIGKKIRFEVFIPTKALVTEIDHKIYPENGMADGRMYRPLEFYLKVPNKQTYMFELDRDEVNKFVHNNNNRFKLNLKITLKYFNFIEEETLISKPYYNYVTFIIDLDRKESETVLPE
jgi:hypothetical protein